MDQNKKIQYVNFVATFDCKCGHTKAGQFCLAITKGQTVDVSRCPNCGDARPLTFSGTSFQAVDVDGQSNNHN